jgi:outer membrane protein assembly factor BamB
MSADDGTELWASETEANWVSSPVVVDDTVYIGGIDQESGILYGMSADDGTEQWAFQTSGHIVSSPAVIDNTVYVGSRDGNVYALSEE